MAKRKRRSFTPEFKADAVRLCRAGDRTISQVAKDLDLTETALRDWVKRADIDAGTGPKEELTSAERAELSELRRRVKRLEMEREILKKSGSLLREGERMRFAFIDAEKAHWPVDALCSVLGVSRSGYYAWRSRPEPASVKADAELAAEIVATHERSRGAYGSPRVHRDLRARGRRVGRKRVERLMRKLGIVAKRRRRFRRTTDSRHAHPIAPNVVDRKFSTPTPDQVWVTDVTSLASAGATDMLVAKFDPSGGHLWSKRFGDDMLDAANGVAADSSGNVIFTGSHMGTVDFGGGPLVYAGGSGYDAVLVKLGP